MNGKRAGSGKTALHKNTRQAIRARNLLRKGWFQLRTLPLRHHGRISAMVRAKDEEQFLSASVRSIIDHVDEVVLVDNLSSDGTPDIIARLRDEFPDKLRSYSYPFEVARAGTENRAELAARGPDSPHLSANYANWCLQRCSTPFVLKWDADMIALATLDHALQQWRASSHVSMWFHGAEVHSDRRHVIAAFQAHHDGAGGMAGTADHVHIFPRRHARWTTGRMSQDLTSPFLAPRVPWGWRMLVEEPVFLHMKFCKPDPLSNVSVGEWSAESLAAVTVPGPLLPPAWRETLERWGLAPAGPAREGRSDAATGTVGREA